jgi:DNA-binding NtrC family response regulator
MSNGATILVVEDDDDALTIMESILELAGYHVSTARSFEAAQPALLAGPDLLITDIRLGAYNGLQLIMRGRAVNPRLRAIVVTAYDDEMLRREAEALGAVHMEKPLDLGRLLDEVTQALAHSSRQLPR